MKTKFLLLAAAATVILSFTGPQTAPDKSLARVEQMQGMFIFVNSTPVAEYDYIGSVKYSGGLGFGSTQFADVRDKLIKRAQKEYPHANGLIFHFATGSADKCDAIKFK